MRTEADIRALAARHHMRVDWIERVPVAGGGSELAAHLSFDDPWDAAALLIDATDEDAGDPVVQAWAYEILRATADAIGDPGGPRVTPALRDATARVIQANVQQWVRFVHETKEKFQAARTTMRTREGDCDCQARLVGALAGALGIPWDIAFYEGWDPVAGQNVPIQAAPKLQDSDGTWQWAETTLAADYGEEPYAALDRLGADLPDDQNPFAGAASSIWPPPVSTTGIGVLGFVTPSDVQSRKDELNAAIDSIDADVIGCTTLPSAQVSAWNDFVIAWRDFYGRAPSFFNAGAQARQASDFDDQIGQWQDKLSAAGCTLSAPHVTKEPETNIVTLATVLGVSAAVIAGALAVREVARASR